VIERFDHSEGDRQSEKFDLENIHDLYKYGDRLKATVRHDETKP
jgi:hypothetical protein